MKNSEKLRYCQLSLNKEISIIAFVNLILISLVIFSLCYHISIVFIVVLIAIAILINYLLFSRYDYLFKMNKLYYKIQLYTILINIDMIYSDRQRYIDGFQQYSYLLDKYHKSTIELFIKESHINKPALNILYYFYNDPEISKLLYMFFYLNHDVEYQSSFNYLVNNTSNEINDLDKKRFNLILLIASLLFVLFMFYIVINFITNIGGFLNVF